MPTLSIPITDDLRPNAYVLRGGRAGPHRRGACAAGTWARLRDRHGRACLPLRIHQPHHQPRGAPLEGRHRPVEGRASALARWSDADVHVVDREGKAVKSTVTFYAVDEGVLLAHELPHARPDSDVHSEPFEETSFRSNRAMAWRGCSSNPKGSAGSDKGDDGGGGGRELHPIGLPFHGVLRAVARDRWRGSGARALQAARQPDDVPLDGGSWRPRMIVLVLPSPR